MKLPTYQFMAQMGAAFAVVVSLGFVAYELKQARDIALAEVYQQKTALNIERVRSHIDPTALLDAYIKLWESPSKLESRDFSLINGDLAAIFSYYENNHFLYQLGMVTEEQMNTIRAVISHSISDNYARHYWMVTSKNGDWRKSFADEVNRIITEAGPAEPFSDSASVAKLKKRKCVASGKCLADGISR